MKVSIITVSKNAGQFVAEAMESVHSQDYNDIEYIIVDGASTDGTVDIIKKHIGSHDKFISEKDDGLYFALNKGINMANGDILGILHTDDLFTDSHVVSKIVQLFNSTKADLVYSDLHYVDRSNPDKIIRNWVSGTYRDGDFFKGWMPPHPTVWARKEVFEKFGDYDTEFKSAADYEWLLRVIHKGKVKVAYLQEVTVKMRVGGKSNVTLVNRLKANKEDRMAWKKNGLKPKPFTLLFKPLSKISQYISSSR